MKKLLDKMFSELTSLWDQRVQNIMKRYQPLIEEEMEKMKEKKKGK